MIDHNIPRNLDDIYGPGAENADDGIDNQEQTIAITPRLDCKACRGTGTLRGDSVPYGSTNVSLPDTYCDCVLDQLPEDGDHLFIELKFDEEVLQRWQSEVRAENEFFAQVETEER